jgi:hypothetical protein
VITLETNRPAADRQRLGCVSRGNRLPTNVVFLGINKRKGVMGRETTKLDEAAIAARIRSTVLSWPGVSAEPHRFGGTEFRLERREIGHIHGGRLVDIPFPRRVRDELIAAGRAERHHVLPDSGWVSFWIRGEDDEARAIELLRIAYDRAVAQRQRQQAVTQSES